MNNENNTKELSFGDSNTESSVSSAPLTSENNNPTPPTSGNGGDNSFYDRKPSNQAETVWYKDWRGKTLAISIAALLLIGAGIPAGMAAAGYWGVNSWEPDNELTTNSSFNLAQKEIDTLYDEAVIEHFNRMDEEGWITSTSQNNTYDDAEKAADDAIDAKRKELKDSYGNTWEEEYDQFLQESGFHTAANGGEEQYKNSIIAGSLLSSTTSIYTNKNKATSKVEDTEVAADDGYIYISESSYNNKKEVVVNSIDTPEETGNNVYSYTPQDLMTGYLLTFEPIVFNNALMPFTPVVGNSTEASIQGNNISMTNEQVKNAWALGVKASTYDPATSDFFGDDMFGGVQSKNKVSFSSAGLGEEADIATLVAMNDDSFATSTTNDISTVVDTAIATAITGTVSSEAIDYLDQDQIKLIEDSLEESLTTAGVLNSIDTTTGTATSKRNFVTTGLISGAVSFVSTNGLNNIGIEIEGKDIVDEQMNSDMRDSDARDFNLWSSYTTWVSNSFKYITILDYLTDPVDGSNGWFTYSSSVPTLNIATNQNWTDFQDSITENFADDEEADADEIISMLPKALFGDVVVDELDNISTTFTEGKTFAETNKKFYDYESYITFGTGEGSKIVNQLTSTNVGSFTMNMFGGAGSTVLIVDTILNKRGDE